MATFEFMNDREFAIRDAEITKYSKNFSGKEKINKKNGRVVNSEGNMNFCIEVPDAMVDRLLEEGWKMKPHNVYDDGPEDPGYYMQINVGYKYKPPIVMLINNKRGKKTRTMLDRDSIYCLDDMPYERVKVSVRGQMMTADDGSRYIKPWLLSLHYFAATVDPFEDDDEYDWDDEAPFDISDDSDEEDYE